VDRGRGKADLLDLTLRFARSFLIKWLSIYDEEGDLFQGSHDRAQGGAGMKRRIEILDRGIDMKSASMPCCTGAVGRLKTGE